MKILVVSGSIGDYVHVVSLTRQTPQSKGKEGSGDHAYSESFSWNAIISKYVIDNRKNSMAGHTCMHRKQGVAWQ